MTKALSTALLIAFGLVHSAQATTCRGKCFFAVQNVLKELSDAEADGAKLYDFRNYCSQVNGTVWSAMTCSGVWGYRCIGTAETYPSNGWDLTAYGSDSYEATQKLREACASKKPASSCSTYASEGYLQSDISCN